MISADGMQKQIELYRRMTGQQRLQIGFELYELARTLVRAGVRHDFPNWDEEQVKKEVNRRFRLAAELKQT